jgi:hypothetical protein
MKIHALPSTASLATLGIVLSALLLPTRALPAPVTAEFQDLKILGHYFTTGVSGSNRSVAVKDATKARYLVMVISATLPKGEGRLYNTDFTLRYLHPDGSEDRANCDVIARTKSIDPAAMFRFQTFAVGETAGIKVDAGQLMVGLGFYVEPDVESVDLYRLGVAEPLTYRIGTDRSYSVVIFTNVDTATLTRAKEVIQKGGYNVVVLADDLASEEKGITIHYREAAESQAREISQRLTAEFGTPTTVKKIELISGADIVVWLGK